MLTLEGFGFPTSPFQVLSVSLLEAEDRTCAVQFSNATHLQCIVSLYTGLPASVTAETFDVQLTANEDVANCIDQENCQITLQLPDELRVLELVSSVVPYEGNVTVLFEDVFLVTGKVSDPEAIRSSDAPFGEKCYNLDLSAQYSA